MLILMDIDPNPNIPLNKAIRKEVYAVVNAKTKKIFVLDISTKSTLHVTSDGHYLLAQDRGELKSQEYKKCGW